MSNTDRLLSDVTSWYWWLTAIALGLILNLAAAYLKSPIDRWLERRSDARRLRSTRLHEDIERQALDLANCPEILPIAAAEETRQQIQGGVLMLMALLCMLATLNLLVPVSGGSRLFTASLFAVLWLGLQVTAFQLIDRAQLKAAILGRAKALLAARSGA